MTSVPGSLNPPAYVPCKLTIVTKQVSAYGSLTPQGTIAQSPHTPERHPQLTKLTVSLGGRRAVGAEGTRSEQKRRSVSYSNAQIRARGADGAAPSNVIKS